MSETFVQETEMPVDAETLFRWHERPGAFERLDPPWDPVKVIQRDDSLKVGAKTVIEMKVGPIPTRWVAEHTAYEPGHLFRDEQIDGPFEKWVHTHRFIDRGGGKSLLRDEVEYVAPLGALGNALGGGTIRATLERMFRYRHALTLADLQRHQQYATRPRLTVAVTGASGTIGATLSSFLTTGGHTVRAVKRGDFSTLEGCDAVVHLAGSSIVERWTESTRKEMVESRVDYTRQLVEALATLKQKPKVLIGGSAVGIYGDRGDEVLTEQSGIGPQSDHGAAMLSRLCHQWEAESLKAKELGIRVALARTGLVLTPRSGVLQKLLTPFKAGVGGPQGDGKQWMCWIDLEDEIGAIHHALFEDTSGPLNLVAPTPVTNEQFAKTLAHVLSRPAVARVPAFALKAMFGEMAEGTVLASQRAVPAKLEAEKFTFLHRELESSLRFMLGHEIEKA